jgi:hypothetical protein
MSYALNLAKVCANLRKVDFVQRPQDGDWEEDTAQKAI